MKSNRLSLVALLLAGSALLLAAPASAQSPPHPTGHAPSGHGGPSGRGAPRFTFNHRDFGHFSPAERANWRGGSWNHGWHNGRYGWWWFAGGAWYFYDAPVYPYPGYVSDYYVDEDAYGPGAPGQFWYYCASPPGYYPYVQTCGSPWQPVPATPPPQGYGPQPGYQGGPYGQPPPGYQGPGQGDQPPPGYQGPNNGPGPGGQPPPGYQGPNNGPGADDQPPPGYQGPDNGPGPGDQPPPGYQGPDNGSGPNGQQPPGYPPGPGNPPGSGPGNQPPPGYQGPGAPPSPPPPNGYNGPNGPN